MQRELPTFARHPATPQGQSVIKRIGQASSEAKLAGKKPTHYLIGSDLLRDLPWPDCDRLGDPTTTVFGLAPWVVDGAGIEVAHRDNLPPPPLPTEPSA